MQSNNQILLHSLLPIPELKQISKHEQILLAFYYKILTLGPYRYMLVSFSFGQYPTAPCTIATSLISPAVDPITHAFNKAILI